MKATIVTILKQYYFRVLSNSDWDNERLYAGRQALRSRLKINSMKARLEYKSRY